MLWVGGHILLVGAEELGWHFPYSVVHHAEEAVHDATGALGGVLGWTVNTLLSAIAGLIIGGLVVAFMAVTFHRKKSHGDDAHAAEAKSGAESTGTEPAQINTETEPAETKAETAAAPVADAGPAESDSPQK
jgi:hypothetical protein